MRSRMNRATSSPWVLIPRMRRRTYIAHTCKALHGAVVREGANQRGMAWSDMAILLRSVRGTGKPIAEALKRVGVPYIVTGMDNLFEQSEAEAARQLFYYLASKTDETSLRQAWERADLGISKDALTRAVIEATKARKNMKKADLGQFQVYNLQRQFMAFLENAELREERVPDRRGEVVFYNLGKFSQAISDFESIHFRSEPVQKYDTFAGFLQYHAEKGLSGGLAGQRLREPGRGANYDRPPSEGPPVAGGIHPTVSTQSIPVYRQPRTHALAPDSSGRLRQRGSLQRQ